MNKPFVPASSKNTNHINRNKITFVTYVVMLQFHYYKFSTFNFQCLSVSEEELRKLKEESNVDSLKQELEKERCRRIELEQKINDALRSRLVVYRFSYIKGARICTLSPLKVILVFHNQFLSCTASLTSSSV